VESLKRKSSTIDHERRPLFVVSRSATKRMYVNHCPAAQMKSVLATERGQNASRNSVLVSVTGGGLRCLVAFCAGCEKFEKHAVAFTFEFFN